MTTTWISPWSGNPVSVEELICEVGMAAVSRLYIFSLVGLPEPEISIEPDSIIITSPKIDYNFVIYYPKELHQEMNGCFSLCLSSLKQEYGVYVKAGEFRNPGGEQVGELLWQFKSLDRLIRLVYARRCWNEHSVFVMHGLQPSQFLSSLKNEMEQAGINYLVTIPLNDETGSGAFKALELQKAIELINDLRTERPGAVEKIFHLEFGYGRHTWVSNSHNWVSQ
jgi:hypothetical protein